MSVYPIKIDRIHQKLARRRFRSDSRRDELFDSGQYIDNVKTIRNEFGEEITRVDGTIPVDLALENEKEFLFISYDQSHLTHGYHRYPAKFFPELPRWLIQKYSKPGETVLDPFTGSGTTNIEALLNGRHSVGIDVDPFSRFLSQVKTTALDRSQLEYSRDIILQGLTHFKPELVENSDIPEFHYRDNWFDRPITLELTYIKNLIFKQDFTQQLKDFFMVCLSSIIRSVSNADDNCTRTVIRKKLNKQVFPTDALVRFGEMVLMNTARAIEFSRICPNDIRVELPDNGDARNIPYPTDFFDLAVTSPPYANAVDYPRTHQLELYWLGFESGSLTPLKKKHVGTESVSAQDYINLHHIGVKEADEVIENIFVKDKRRAFIAYKYLEDMKCNLIEVCRTLKPNGRYIIVVGNNHIRGELFESWKYLMRIAEDIGFTIENYFGSEIIRHFIKVPREERITTDWIIVLRKEKRNNE